MPTDRPRKRDACDDHDMRQGVNLGTESDNSLEANWKALGTLYHNFFSGLILSLSSREGQDVAGEWSFNLFRRQHHEKFRSSLDKLGLTGLSDAVAAARYHYLSNLIGGVEVEYVEESDTKAWVRFPHPRWIYMGTAICGIPDTVGQGYVRGWYGQNGVSLKNPKLGFVCTSQDTHVGCGFSGYFMEYDHELSVDDRARFIEGEIMPQFDPAFAPILDSNIWTKERLNRARRNYAMEYIRSGLTELIPLIGVDRTYAIGDITAQLIGRQFYLGLLEILGFDPADRSLNAFGRFMTAMAMAHNDEVEIAHEGGGITISQSGWRLACNMADSPPVIFDVWNALWEGCLCAHDRIRRMEVLKRPAHSGDSVIWTIS